MERSSGTVAYFDGQANYGFIEPDDGGPDVVFSVRPGDPPVAAGDVVGFELIPRPQVTQRGREALRIWKLGFEPAAA